MKYSIKIKIQSFSAIITNSSSEVFCIISSEEKLQAVFDLLISIVGDRTSIDSPSIHLCDNSDGDYGSENFGSKWISIEMPYDATHCDTLLKAGLNAILKEHFNDSDYEIEWIKK